MGRERGIEVLWGLVDGLGNWWGSELGWKRGGREVKGGFGIAKGGVEKECKMECSFFLFSRYLRECGENLTILRISLLL